MKKRILLYVIFFTTVINAQIANSPDTIQVCDDDTDGIVCLDLTIQNPQILGSQNPFDFTITYHASEADANTGVNVLSIPYCNTSSWETIYVRLEDNSTGMFDTTSFDVFVDAAPEVPESSLSISLCDDVDSNDGFIAFDLRTIQSTIMGTQSIISYSLAYFESETDALTNTNPIANPDSYTNTSANQVIWARLTENTTGCFSLKSFSLIVDPPLNFQQPTPLEACDADGDGFTTFALNTKIEEILNGAPGYSLRFYNSEMDAYTMQHPISSSSFTNTVAYTQTVYARVDLRHSLATNCLQIIPVELIATTGICDAVPNETIYEVASIPYQIYDIDTTVFTSNYDDIFSDIIDLSFNFDFFGQTYDQMVIGTNGAISFNTSYGSNLCPWYLPIGLSLPSVNLPLNSILGVFHDMDDIATDTGIIGYALTGQAPYRKMVVFFDEVNQFGGQCEDPSTTQMILYETFNIIDVQVKEKIACLGWNDGNAIIGIQNATGNVAYFPENRNSGAWDAIDEGHRFYPQSTYENIHFVICDDDMDGFQEFDLTTLTTEVLGDISNATVDYFVSETDALNMSNPLPELFTNTTNAQVIYANILNNTTNEVALKTITLATIDCTVDTDVDGVATLDEDVNGDGNLGNDDTDGDGIPDFADEDDDGDFVLTSLELINTNTLTSGNGFLDTDNDLIPNHRDADDDDDGIPTIDEDYNGNNNPTDDDVNNNNIPDYLDATVALGISEFENVTIRIYPNPAKSQLTIETAASIRISSLEVYSVEGQLVSARNQVSIENTLSVNVSNFASGFYILKIRTKGNTVITKRFIVE